jgi:hypothetical protein
MSGKRAVLSRRARMNTSRFRCRNAARIADATWSVKASLGLSLGHGPQLLETLVHRNPGAWKPLSRNVCYRAANWIYVGETAGRDRMDHDHNAHGQGGQRYLRFSACATRGDGYIRRSHAVNRYPDSYRKSRRGRGSSDSIRFQRHASEAFFDGPLPAILSSVRNHLDGLHGVVFEARYSLSLVSSR